MMYCGFAFLVPAVAIVSASAAPLTGEAAMQHLKKSALQSCQRSYSHRRLALGQPRLWCGANPRPAGRTQSHRPARRTHARRVSNSVFQSVTMPSPPAAAIVFPSGLNTACQAMPPPGGGRVNSSASLELDSELRSGALARSLWLSCSGMEFLPLEVYLVHPRQFATIIKASAATQLIPFEGQHAGFPAPKGFMNLPSTFSNAPDCD